MHRSKSVSESGMITNGKNDRLYLNKSLASVSQLPQRYVHDKCSTDENVTEIESLSNGCVSNDLQEEENDLLKQYCIDMQLPPLKRRLSLKQNLHVNELLATAKLSHPSVESCGYRKPQTNSSMKHGDASNSTFDNQFSNNSNSQPSSSESRIGERMKDLEKLIVLQQEQLRRRRSSISSMGMGAWLDGVDLESTGDLSRSNSLSLVPRNISSHQEGRNNVEDLGDYSNIYTANRRGENVYDVEVGKQKYDKNDMINNYSTAQSKGRSCKRNIHDKQYQGQEYHSNNSSGMSSSNANIQQRTGTRDHRSRSIDLVTHNMKKSHNSEEHRHHHHPFFQDIKHQEKKKNLLSGMPPVARRESLNRLFGNLDSRGNLNRRNSSMTGSLSLGDISIDLPSSPRECVKFLEISASVTTSANNKAADNSAKSHDRSGSLSLLSDAALAASSIRISSMKNGGLPGQTLPSQNPPRRDSLALLGDAAFSLPSRHTENQTRDLGRSGDFGTTGHRGGIAHISQEFHNESDDVDKFIDENGSISRHSSFQARASEFISLEMKLQEKIKMLQHEGRRPTATSNSIYSSTIPANNINNHSKDGNLRQVSRSPHFSNNLSTKKVVKDVEEISLFQQSRKLEAEKEKLFSQQDHYNLPNTTKSIDNRVRDSLQSSYNPPSLVSSTNSVDAIETYMKISSMFQTLKQCMRKSQQSQRSIQAWDKKMGLKRSHSSTMTKTTQSRNQLKQMFEIQMKVMGQQIGNFDSDNGDVCRKTGKVKRKRNKKFAEVEEINSNEDSVKEHGAHAETLIHNEINQQTAGHKGNKMCSSQGQGLDAKLSKGKQISQIA